MKLLNLALLAKVFAAVDIDEELALTGIEPGSLLMRSPPRGLFNSTGPALKQKIFELQTLYQEQRLAKNQRINWIMIHVSKQ